MTQLIEIDLELHSNEEKIWDLNPAQIDWINPTASVRAIDEEEDEYEEEDDEDEYEDDDEEELEDED